MSNFEFLKNINKDLFLLASEAEKLFKDGYFEQCMSQTRRFAENMCRLVMQDRAQPSDSFDMMLATLKDTPSPSEEEKEFLDDLYFLKKAGNEAAHSIKSGNNADTGKKALECLERAFESSLNFAVFFCKSDSKLLNLVFDEELLMTGRKSEAAALQAEYTARKKKELAENKNKKNSSKTALKEKSQKVRKKSKKTNLELYEEYLEAKKERQKKNKIFKNKSLLREIAETILAGIIIYIGYLLIFPK